MTNSPVTRDRYALALAIKHRDWGKAMEFVKVCPYCHGWHVALGLQTDFCSNPCAVKNRVLRMQRRKAETLRNGIKTAGKDTT